jgi:hypothetical protein
MMDLVRYEMVQMDLYDCIQRWRFGRYFDRVLDNRDDLYTMVVGRVLVLPKYVDSNSFIDTI